MGQEMRDKGPGDGSGDRNGDEDIERRNTEMEQVIERQGWGGGRRGSEKQGARETGQGWDRNQRDGGQRDRETDRVTGQNLNQETEGGEGAPRMNMWERVQASPSRWRTARAGLGKDICHPNPLGPSRFPVLPCLLPRSVHLRL